MHIFTCKIVILPVTTSSVAHHPPSFRSICKHMLLEFVIKLQYMHSTSFTRQSAMSPRKTPIQELKQKMCFFQLLLGFCKSFSWVNRLQNNDQLAGMRLKECRLMNLVRVRNTNNSINIHKILMFIY
jgi:uncharacterized membrane protein